MLKQSQMAQNNNNSLGKRLQAIFATDPLKKFDYALWKMIDKIILDYQASDSIQRRWRDDPSTKGTIEFTMMPQFICGIEDKILLQQQIKIFKSREELDLTFEFFHVEMTHLAIPRSELQILIRIFLDINKE